MIIQVGAQCKTTIVQAKTKLREMGQIRLKWRHNVLYGWDPVRNQKFEVTGDTNFLKLMNVTGQPFYRTCTERDKWMTGEVEMALPDEQVPGVEFRRMIEAFPDDVAFSAHDIPWRYPAAYYDHVALGSDLPNRPQFCATSRFFEEFTVNDPLNMTAGLFELFGQGYAYMDEYPWETPGSLHRVERVVQTIQSSYIREINNRQQSTAVHVRLATDDLEEYNNMLLNGGCDSDNDNDDDEDIEDPIDASLVPMPPGEDVDDMRRAKPHVYLTNPNARLMNILVHAPMKTINIHDMFYEGKKRLTPGGMDTGDDEDSSAVSSSSGDDDDGSDISDSEQSSPCRKMKVVEDA